MKFDPSSLNSIQTRSKVAVVKTTPSTVLEDVGRVMRLAGFSSCLDKSFATLLKINTSWQYYYPACSTTPWQLEGVIKTLRGDGYQRIIPAHNGTVVVDPREGAANNKHDIVENRYGLSSIFLEDPSVKWIKYIPKKLCVFGYKS